MRLRLSWIALPFLLGAAFAMAADEVLMATSEDLNAFDSQLGKVAAQPTQRPNNGIGAKVSAEAKALKDTLEKQPFGHEVREMARGHGVGAVPSMDRREAVGRDRAPVEREKNRKK